MVVSVVTGANSGIGRATALKLAAEGHQVFGTMRSLDKGEKLAAMADDLGVAVTPIVADVAIDESVRTAMAEIFEAAGRVDVLVNNAGIGWNATVEDVDIEAAKQVFEANYWGIIRCTQAVLPSMREHRSGVIANISSIAGRIAALGQPVYSSSKWAVEALSEGLAQEVAAFGIRVAIIEPGVTRTAILAKNPDFPQPTVYGEAYTRMLEFYAAGIQANVGSEVVADTVFEAVTTDEPKLRWPVAWGAEELIAGREAMSDEAWVELGSLVPEGPAYTERFTDLFGLPLS